MGWLPANARVSRLGHAGRRLPGVPADRLLAVLSSDPEGPVVRHRWRAYADALLGAGIVLEVVPWPRSPRGRFRALTRASVADGLVISSRLVRRVDLRRLRHRARRLALDFDDALPFRDSTHGAARSPTRTKRFRAVVRAADAVFAGNERLAWMAECEGVRATVLPTTVCVPPLAPVPPARVPRLGWIGSRATLPYLEQIAIPLGALVASGHALQVVVVADRAPTFPPGIPVEFVPWTLEGWEAALASVHVGLAPLPDDAWARGKCGLRVLHFLALGRPVVASPVGVQCQQVRPEQTGLLASQPSQWVAALERLLRDGDLRARWGAAAHADAMERWSVSAWAPRVIQAVSEWLA